MIIAKNYSKFICFILSLILILTPTISSATVNLNMSNYFEDMYINYYEASPNSVISTILIWYLGLCVAGAVWDGTKWVVSSVYEDGFEATAKAAVVFVNSYTPQGTPYRSIDSVYMKTKTTADYILNTSGCVLHRGGNQWICPYSLPIDLSQQKNNLFISPILA